MTVLSPSDGSAAADEPAVGDGSRRQGAPGRRAADRARAEMIAGVDAHVGRSRPDGPGAAGVPGRAVAVVAPPQRSRRETVVGGLLARPAGRHMGGRATRVVPRRDPGVAEDERWGPGWADLRRRQRNARLAVAAGLALAAGLTVAALATARTPTAHVPIVTSGVGSSAGVGPAGLTPSAQPVPGAATP